MTFGRLGLAGLVLMALSLPSQAASIVGSYKIVSVAGGTVDPAKATLTITDDGAVAAYLGCNHMMGKAKISGEFIKFAPLASTLMACPAPQMAADRALASALAGVKSWSGKGQTIRLRGLLQTQVVLQRQFGRHHR